MRKYFESNVEAVKWAYDNQTDDLLAVVDRTYSEGGIWFVDLHSVESESSAYERLADDVVPLHSEADRYDGYDESVPESW